MGRNNVLRQRRKAYSRDFRLSALLRNASGTEDATVQNLRTLFYIRRDDRFIAGDIESLERERTTSIEYSTGIAPMGIVVPLFCVGMILYSYLCMSNVFLMLQLLRRLLFCIEQLESGTMKARLATKEEHRIGLSRKKSSTLAAQASEPRYVLQRQCFWHLPYPFGIADISSEEMIDMDEAKIIIQTGSQSQVWKMCHDSSLPQVRSLWTWTR